MIKLGILLSCCKWLCSWFAILYCLQPIFWNGTFFTWASWPARCPGVKGRPAPLRKDPASCQQFILFIFLPASPKGTYSLSQGDCALEERRWSDLERLLRTSTEQTNFRKVKASLWPTSQSRGLGGQVISGVLAQLHVSWWAQWVPKATLWLFLQF